MTVAPDAEVLVERSGGVATITLHRPDALNAITPTMLVSLGDELDRLDVDEDVTVVVLTGAGRAFCAGVDLKALGDRELVGGSVGDLLDVPARRVAELLSSMRAITIAKVNGFCFTGALELVLACDLAVVANEAKFGDTHAKFGLRPTWGLSARLPRAVGMRAARELSYTARTFTGVEAKELGLAVRAAPLADLDGVVADLVAAISANSRDSLLAYKDLYRAGAERSLDEALAYEAAMRFEIADTAARLDGFR